MIKKLEFYGIRGHANKWFLSYLTCRRQFVSINNISVLGPLLFLLYINDFANCATTLDFHIFADDSNLFFRSNNLLSLQNTLNNELTKVYEWFCVNRLSLNIKKSNFVIFHPRQRKTPNNLEITINDQLLKQEYTIKYLGLILDCNLSWKDHISFVESKVKRSIGILSKLRYFVSLNTLRNLYYALIYPFLTYALIVWGCTYPSTLQSLFILQKRSIRIITFSKYYEHTSMLFKSLNIIKLIDLVTFHVAVFMKKFYNKLLPSVFDDFFRSASDVHDYNTRFYTSQTFGIPKARTNYGIFNIIFHGAEVWNSIADDVKYLSIKRCKKKIKEDMIENY